jgi:hypothetical protein
MLDVMHALYAGVSPTTMVMVDHERSWFSTMLAAPNPAN